MRLVGALKEALRRMIIRQRSTLLDPFLLKVVFPYLETGNHRTLLRLASLWYAKVAREPMPGQKQGDRQAGQQNRLGWQHWLRALARALQPQVLAPIAIVAGRARRPFRPYRGEG